MATKRGVSGSKKKPGPKPKPQKERRTRPIQLSLTEEEARWIEEQAEAEGGMPPAVWVRREALRNLKKRARRTG